MRAQWPLVMVDGSTETWNTTMIYALFAGFSFATTKSRY